MAFYGFEDNGLYRSDIYIFGSSAVSITTTDATPTITASIPTVINKKYKIEIEFVVSETASATGAYTGSLMAGFGRTSGNITKIDNDLIQSVTGYSGSTPNIATVANTSSQTIDIQITGRAATTLQWILKVTVKYRV